MSNTLTAIAPALYSDGRIVPRERVGFVQSVTTDFNDQGAAKGDTVKITVAPTMSTGTYTPAQTFAAGTDSIPTTLSLTLSQSKEVTWNLTAEEEKSLMNSGVAQDYAAQRVKQAIRAMVNGIESYVGTVADVGCSRGYGTATTTPFGTAANLTDSAAMFKILEDNGAALDNGLSLVLDTTAGANIRGVQTNLFKANEAGSAELLRRGVLGSIHGFDLRESAGVALHTAGGGTSYVVNGSHAVGATSIVVKTGSGTILAGDVVSINSVKYVVKTGVAAPGTMVIQEPGLLATASDSDTVTITATHRANIALHKSAIALVARPALQPVSSNCEQMVVSDEVTGLSFLLVRNVGSGMSSWYLRCVYDAFAANPYAMAKLIG